MTEKKHDVPSDVKAALITGPPVGGAEPLSFTHVETYTTFNAEWTLIDEDYVFHFFPSEEVAKRPDARAYWETQFPGCLDVVAQEVFKATFPRLQATFVPELNSWWLRAHGFRSLGAPEALPDELLLKLDAALEAASFK